MAEYEAQLRPVPRLLPREVIRLQDPMFNTRIPFGLNDYSSCGTLKRPVFDSGSVVDCLDGETCPEVYPS